MPKPNNLVVSLGRVNQIREEIQGWMKFFKIKDDQPKSIMCVLQAFCDSVWQDHDDHEGAILYVLQEYLTGATKNLNIKVEGADT